MIENAMSIETLLVKIYILPTTDAPLNYSLIQIISLVGSNEGRTCNSRKRDPSATTHTEPRLGKVRSR